MAPFTKRPTAPGTAQLLVRCWVEQPGSYDGEEHEAGEWIYLDEIQAHVLQRERRVRIATAEEHYVVQAAEERTGVCPQSWPRLSMDMGL